MTAPLGLTPPQLLLPLNGRVVNLGDANVDTPSMLAPLPLPVPGLSPMNASPTWQQVCDTPVSEGPDFFSRPSFMQAPLFQRSISFQGNVSPFPSPRSNTTPTSLTGNMPTSFGMPHAGGDPSMIPRLGSHGPGGDPLMIPRLGSHGPSRSASSPNQHPGCVSPQFRHPGPNNCGFGMDPTETRFRVPPQWPAPPGSLHGHTQLC